MTKALSSDVEITLDGRDFVLRSSLKAATAISSHFGGFISAYQHLASGSLDAFQYVIRQGVPKAQQDDISTQDMNAMIWRTGTPKLVGPVTKYLSRLQNGGRDPDEDDSQADTEDGDAGNGEI